MYCETENCFKQNVALIRLVFLHFSFLFFLFLLLCGGGEKLCICLNDCLIICPCKIILYCSANATFRKMGQNALEEVVLHQFLQKLSFEILCHLGKMLR